MVLGKRSFSFGRGFGEFFSGEMFVLGRVHMFNRVNLVGVLFYHPASINAQVKLGIIITPSIGTETSHEKNPLTFHEILVV